jgi:hypothetical protein
MLSMGFYRFYEEVVIAQNKTDLSAGSLRVPIEASDDFDSDFLIK